MKKSCEIKASYCNKEGGIIHSIKKRYFVLYSDALKYYTTIQGEEKGSIPITPDLIVDNDSKYKIQPCFTIYNPSKKRTYYILPESEIDRNEWINILINVICNKKVNGPQIFLTKLPEIYEYYVTLSELVWNAKKEDIPTIIKLMKNATTKNALSMKQILGMIDYIAQRRLKNLEVMAELAHEYIHSQRVPDILSYFKECEHLVAILIKRCALTGKMPEKFVGKSEKDILDIYPPGSLFHSLLHDNIDTLKKTIDDPSFNIEKTYDGKSILALAARFGSENCFRYILSKNSPINVDVFEDAYFGGNIQVVEMLKTAHFEPLSCIDLAIQNHQSELATYLMRSKDQEYTWEAALRSYNFKAFFDKLYSKEDVDSKDSKEMTPIMAAAAAGFPFIVKILHEIGSYIEVRGLNNYTTLHYATVNDNSETVTFLSSLNVNFNALTEENETPLILAAKYGLFDIGSQLINHVSNIDHQDKSGNTALIYASKNGLQNFVSLLIEKNSNVSIANNEGNTAIFYAALSGKSEIVTQLVDKKAQVNIKNNKGETPLIWAAREGNIDVVNTLLDYKALIEEKDAEYLTPLQHAVRADKPDVVRRLLNKGASQNMFDKTGVTPLMYSCSKNLIQTTKVLLDSKCNTEITDFEGKTAIIYACLSNAAECINLLIKAGANKESTDKFGRTPLLIAMASKSYDASYALVLNKCNDYVHDVQGGTPFFYAVYYKDTRMACHLMNNCTWVDINQLIDGKVPLIHAIECRSLEMVKCLLDLHARLDVRDTHGLPPLCLAASVNAIDIVKVLLEQKECTIDDKDLRGSTPLMHASANGLIDMINLLIEKGANLEATNMTNCTPLFFAVSEKHVDAAKVLLERKAEVNYFDLSGTSPLMAAASNDDVEMVKLLLSYHADKSAKNREDQTAKDIALSSGAKAVLSLL